MQSTVPGDIDDYLLVYAPNSGQQQCTLAAQERVAKEVQQAMWHHEVVLGRRLNVVGDLNFTHLGERKLRSRAKDRDVGEVVEQAVGLQRVANLRDSETRIAKATYLAGHPVDVEAELARREERPVRTTAELDLRRFPETKRKSEEKGKFKGG